MRVIKTYKSEVVDCNLRHVIRKAQNDVKELLKQKGAIHCTGGLGEKLVITFAWEKVKGYKSTKREHLEAMKLLNSPV